MKNKTKSAKILPPSETYICPICGNSHKNGELCPVVLSRHNKIKYDTQSYIMGGILLECLERGVGFFQIIDEISYIMEELSLISPSERIYLNTDFIISYFSSVIGCSPFTFYKKLPELALKYDSYIDKGSVSLLEFDGVDVDDHNNILDICMKLDVYDGPLGELLDSAGSSHMPHLYLHKVYRGRKPTYHLLMNYCRIETGRCLKPATDSNYKPVFHVSNICFGEHTSIDGFELYAEKEGKLQEIFESEFEWEDVADEISCSNSEAYNWTLKIDEATKNGLLKWIKKYSNLDVRYYTTYGQAEVEICITHTIPQEDDKDAFLAKAYAHGDYIRIYENERRMYHYGEVPISGWEYREKYGNEGTELIQLPMFRRVARTVDKWEEMYKEHGFIESRQKKPIRKTDVLSVTYSFVCSEKGHIVVPCCGLVSIITPDGEELEEKVYLGYCRNCNVYYIFRRDYELLCKKGTLQCKIIDAVTKKTLSDVTFNFNEKSVLSEMGYNVQASENLSSEERHQILKRAIEEKKISVNEIINLLELQINLHSGNERYANAIEKWIEDSLFVKSYGINSGRNKQISSIQV